MLSKPPVLDIEAVMVKLAFAIIAIFTSWAAQAQEMKVVSFPEIGVETTVPAGGEVFSYLKVYTINGVTLDVATKTAYFLW